MYNYIKVIIDAISQGKQKIHK